jgi:hypothetical protein
MRALLALLALVASPGLWAAPLDLPPPGTGQQAIDLSAFACAGDPAELTCRQAHAGAAMLYGVPLRASKLFFRDGLLLRASAVFAEARYQEVRDALVAEMGQGEEGVELLVAGMAGVFPSRFGVWRAGGRVFLLEQYFERVRDSALTVMTDIERTRPVDRNTAAKRDRL